MRRVFIVHFAIALAACASSTATPSASTSTSPVTSAGSAGSSSPAAAIGVTPAALEHGAAAAREPASLREIRRLVETSVGRTLPGAIGERTVELSIDPAAQSIVDDEVDALARQPKTRTASVVVVDPKTGALLALGGRRGPAARASTVADGVDLPARAAYVPGSVAKVFSIAAALDRGTVRPDQSFVFTADALAFGGGTVHDATPHRRLDVGDVLAFSSNVGTTKIYETLGKEPLSRALTAFHFGRVPAVQLDGATAGELLPASTWTELEAAKIAFGGGMRASPLQAALAFAAVADDGAYNAPTLVRRVVGRDGSVVWEHHPSHEPVIRADTARTLLHLLEGVVHRDDATGTEARIPGYRVAGKTGTSSIDARGDEPKAAYASFVGAIPARAPRVVILVGVETEESGYSGGTVAAPAFRRVGERLAAHLGLPQGE